MRMDIKSLGKILDEMTNFFNGDFSGLTKGIEGPLAQFEELANLPSKQKV